MPRGKRPPKHRAADQHSISSLFSAAKSRRRQRQRQKQRPKSQIQRITRSSKTRLPTSLYPTTLGLWSIVGWTHVTAQMRKSCAVRYLQGHFKPGLDFSFPSRLEKKKKISKRKFQLAWLGQYPWLVYSPKCDGGFCLPCLFFSSSDMNGALYDKPLTFFTSSASVLKRHAAQEGHKDAIAKECNFQ